LTIVLHGAVTRPRFFTLCTTTLEVLHIPGVDVTFGFLFLTATRNQRPRLNNVIVDRSLANGIVFRPRLKCSEPIASDFLMPLIFTVHEYKEAFSAV
jgi:hypothetical protein